MVKKKNLPLMLKTQVWSLGKEDPLEKGMVTHCNILAWRIPWTEKPGELQSVGSQRIGHDWVTNTFTSLLQWNDHLERQQEDGNWKPRRESQRKPNLLALWYWTTSLQSCEKINFCCLSHPACGTLLRSSQQQTKLTKTINSCLCRNN